MFLRTHRTKVQDQVPSCNTKYIGLSPSKHSYLVVYQIYGLKDSWHFQKSIDTPHLKIPKGFNMHSTVCNTVTSCMEQVPTQNGLNIAHSTHSGLGNILNLIPRLHLGLDCI